MPKVSVLIPNYNHATFLEKRIESVLGQTYQDIEIIFLDDASTDDSREVYKKFAGDKRIVKGIFNEANTGNTFKSWDRLIKESKGEYVWIAESDDYADKRFLERTVGILDKYPSVGLVYTHSWTMDDKDRILGIYKYATSSFSDRYTKDFMNNGRDECTNYLIFENTIPNVSAVLFRRYLYEKAGGVDIGMKLAGDWSLYVKLLLMSDIYYISEPLNYFRWHFNTQRRRWIDTDYIYLEWLDVIDMIRGAAGVSQENLEKVSYEILRNIRILIVTGALALKYPVLSVIVKRLLKLNHRLKFKLLICKDIIACNYFFKTARKIKRKLVSFIARR